MKSGIVGYGAYIPRYRITVEEIARVWGKDGKHVSAGLGVKEKAVAAMDEDTATISIEAARRALEQSGINPQKIGAIYVGSESHPYAVKPTATIVTDAINAGPELTAADLEFACKAGTAGIQMCAGMVESGMIEYGMSIGADTAQGRPNDVLEFTAASGGAAIIVGKKPSEVIAKLEDTYSFTTDTPDFWRRQHAEFPKHAGRFTGEPAYFKHLISAAQGVMKKTGLKAKDVDYFVPHQPNGKFPMLAAKSLGIGLEKLEQALLTPMVGNSYSGSSMVGLASVLDKARAGDKILMVSYGSGAGSDAFVFTATKILEKKRAKVAVKKMIEEKEYIDYAKYVIFRKKLKTI
ncbi:MAG: hydroxymethylglutaryl-CoA synthase [archaeon GW2011_AR10]|uniref:Hydroxymethylglutaryl-CoA synthase n=1 Tax=Candidatus Iainarchaeum sp. TaxID=3101447 RepID=A0A7J4IR15_9ARCH|nr:MAG: hydroxymethylglutaryl-CoA synthase [archaeon GW2011_AR10]HIH07928.1 hydroxymethylglutaryl-CoA synthase [Candidatus Diapherotrites archaeon]